MSRRRAGAASQRFSGAASGAASDVPSGTTSRALSGVMAGAVSVAAFGAAAVAAWRSARASRGPGGTEDASDPRATHGLRTSGTGELGVVAQWAGDRSSIGPFDDRAAGVFGPDGVKAAVLRFARRRDWAWLGRLLQVQQRFSELRGNDLAASVTLQAFLGLFPLLLLAIAVLGFLQAGSADFADDVVRDLGLTGDAADRVEDALETAASSRRVSSVIGLVGLLWAALGFTGALRLAYNRAWQAEGRGVRDRAVGLLWLLGAALVFALGASATVLAQFLPGPARVPSVVLGAVVSFALFLWTSRVLPNVDVGWRSLVPGALVGAAGLEILKFLGGYVVPRTVGRATAVWGTLGVVFAVLAWLLLLGRLVVYSAVVDVVLHEAKEGTVVGVVDQPRRPGVTRVANRSGTGRAGATSPDDATVVVAPR
jgi:membrane protein